MSEPVGAPASRVLIIEDKPEVLDALRARLRQTPGWSIAPDAADGADPAFQALRQKTYDVVLVDAQVAGGDGLRILEQIRQLHPRVAVIVMSAAGSEKTAVEAMRRGAVDYVVDQDLLKADLGQLLRRAVELQLLQVENTELRQVNRMKDEFISSASHELRTPLAVILGYAKTMEDGELGPLTPPQALAVKAIRTRGERLLDMLTRLLTFKETRFGMQEVLLRPADIGLFLQRLLDEDWPPEKCRGVALERELPETPLWALADPEHLREIVNGLISNAVKFSQPGTTVKVSLAARSQEVWIRVQDQGRGIMPEALPRVFVPFTHTDNDMTREVSGLGLGLALARQLVELHGGRIWLESEGSGKGTTAFVSLSRVQPDAPVVVVEKERRLDKKRILVVEDNDDIVEIIRLFLAGFSENIVLTTTDQGQQALELMIRQPFDLLLLDLILPGSLSGADILERMKRMPPDKRMPVLILSGHEAAAKEAVRGGADDYLLKPFNRNRFIGKVLQMLGLERRAHPRS